MALGEGSVRRAIHMLDEDATAVIDEVSALLAALPRVDGKRVFALAESLSRRGAEDAFALALDTAGAVGVRATRGRGGGRAGAPCAPCGGM